MRLGGEAPLQEEELPQNRHQKGACVSLRWRVLPLDNTAVPWSWNLASDLGPGALPADTDTGQGLLVRDGGWGMLSGMLAGVAGLGPWPRDTGAEEDGLGP